MAKKKLSDVLDVFLDENIQNERLEDIVGERFGRYSKYIIQDRALPDVRDGLKPVQRRILYAMYKLGMFSDKPYKKSARITGEVIGKYHPHGDSSVYEAMVRMSQDFKMLMPLIDMHGNNGSIDGDPAAASRYTEARLSKTAEYLLKDLNKKTVDFVPNFDDEELEPVVLPAKFPNLLVNGTQGIASGYATNIPPHNLNEVIRATIKRIDFPDSTVDDIMKIIKGPDFPTGGIIQGRKGIKEAYETGSGKILIKSKTEIIENKNNYQIVITEIPFEVNKSVLVKKLDEIRIKKKVSGIIEIRDESDREGLKIVADVKKDTDPELILNYFLKTTDLQKNYNFNIVAIDNKTPVQMGILRVLDAYISHQKEVVTNRSNFELNRYIKRLHIVEGLIKMVSILDQVIETIRASKNKSDAKTNIMKKFEFTEEQSEAIVTLQLYRLSNTDIQELKIEFDNLTQNIKYLKEVLSNEKTLLEIIKFELESTRNTLRIPRKTNVEEEIELIKIAEEELVDEEDTIVVVTAEDYIKRTNLRSYAASKGAPPTIKENDAVTSEFKVTTLYTMLFFTNLGNYIYLPVFRIPDVKWKDLGQYINNIIPIEDDEKIIASIPIKNFDEDKYILLTTRNNLIKRTELKEFNATRYNKPIRAIKLRGNDRLVSADIVTGNDLKDILVITELGYVQRYLSEEVPVVSTTASGVKAIDLKHDKKDKIASAKYVIDSDQIIMLTNRGNIKRVRVSNIPLSGRYNKPTEEFQNVKNNPHLVTDVVLLPKEYAKEELVMTIIANKGNKDITYKNDLLKATAGKGRSVIVEKKLGESELLVVKKEIEWFEEDIEELTTIRDERNIKLEAEKRIVEEQQEQKRLEREQKRKEKEEENKKLVEKEERIMQASLFDDVEEKE